MNKGIKVRTFLFLRKVGLLCKKSPPVRLRLRVQSTVYPNEILSQVEFQAYHYLSNKKNSYRNCKFDVDSRTCECGIDLDQFGSKGCKSKVQKQLILG